MTPPIFSYEGLGLLQGFWLFRELDIHIGAQDRLALIGRNGVGKTTLLRLICDQIEADEGKRIIVPGTNIVMLEQEPDFSRYETLMDFAVAGKNGPAVYAVEAIAGQLDIDMNCQAALASGGERRRAAIARALAMNPDILLLDEPTNHLDLAAIDWLEQWLDRYNGAFLVISHDRRFLMRLTRQTLWLDRGIMRRKEIGFGGFEAWTERVYAEETRAAQRLDAKLRREAHWRERGVTARRRRNRGRLDKLMELRAQRAAMLGNPGVAALGLKNDDIRSKSVIVADNVSVSLGERLIIKNLDFRVQRGDRIGIVGSNGVGKTTLLRLLTGELAPDSGSVTLAPTLDGIVIDQQRRLLQPDKYVRDILADGGDWVDVRGVKKHVKGYLKEFLFEPELVDTPIGALSGGERSRLLLAREFARESNLLVLDEPTNDLDLETLDLLQEVIADYDGTVLLVSHDRDFLDRTVTVTLGLDGSGAVDIVAGGYADWEKKRQKRTPRRTAKRPSQRPSQRPDKPMQRRKTASTQHSEALPTQHTTAQKDYSPPPHVQTPSATHRRKLTYRDQRDYDLLPDRIEEIDTEMQKIEAELADASLFSREQARYAALTQRLDALREEKTAAEERWLALAERAESLL